MPPRISSEEKFHIFSKTSHIIHRPRVVSKQPKCTLKFLFKYILFYSFCDVFPIFGKLKEERVTKFVISGFRQTR